MEHLFTVVKILGSLALFLYGMKLMSEGLQHIAGHKLRTLLMAMTKNRFTGVFSGFVITSLLQSSSATTVMTVSFVNAGIISLTESAGLMMGANIGTTITGWLVSVIGLKIKIENIALPLLAIGLPLILGSSIKKKNWGEAIIGFSILFLGLAALKDAVPDLRENEYVINLLHQYSDGGFGSRLVFVLAGALLTIIMQSSSAAMTLTIALTLKGLPIDIAAAMVLGENIGTTITAELASLVGNVHAKRSARIHSLFNIIGVSWMILILPYFMEVLNIVFPSTDLEHSNKFALAAFHTSFNIINVALLIGFSSFLVKMAIKTVPQRKKSDQDYELKYINNFNFGAAEISIEEAKREISHFINVNITMIETLSSMLYENSEDKRAKKIKKLKKAENFTDDMEEQITKFLSKVSENKLGSSSSSEIVKYLFIIKQQEEFSDIILRISNAFERRTLYSDHKEKVNSKEIENLLGRVKKQQELFLDIFNKGLKIKRTDNLFILNKKVRKETKKFQQDQFVDLNIAKPDVRLGIIYRDIYHGIENLNTLIYELLEESEEL